MKQRRTILYTEQQQAAMQAVRDAGKALETARAKQKVASSRASEAVRQALLLGIHYKELDGISESFAYRVLRDTKAA